MKTKTYSGINLDAKVNIQSAEAKEIGRIFKEKREEMNYSVERVHLDTHISARFIHSIENGDFTHLPAEVYLLGTLRRYAGYLELDADKILGQYYSKTKETKPKEEPKPQKEREQDMSKMFAFLAVSLFVAAIVISIYKISNRTETKVAEAPVPVQAVTVVETPAQNLLKLYVKSKQSSWVKVYAEDKIVFEGIMSPGIEKEWETAKEFQLKVGYVPALEVKLNGKTVDITKGAQQDVNSLVLNWDSLK
ncbi:MAG TPA: hypothetical protein DEE98_01030 [Elusimicrobia bacterium]|nr:MAG: hypothetical protein A2278_03640 [Elusimicrobia bacterium RIFOXYA12_FULL_49_49]OGS09472.1 MAG: hypothetical protein A2204_03690 [Elusimicrobia bacterium RIFOXYA1_FULL_47_7]OGS11253.1 MAG: hypothetical protein A2386_02020 [Elusimicrobia bacterium RIFOXYB1_FULL_48_9]OGS15651.1 MAG: hypothetical protein A2251_03895 [Elusimicrobia bacterium RIFOXYA2_FULL_47_53]OGS26793.1 MAG: hypothetical protein A2339_07085 [Elusimicrobia bacterium RIFOXYB12_FULL_50_12]OGS30750.1 MAG: hypothetical protein